MPISKLQVLDSHRRLYHYFKERIDEMGPEESPELISYRSNIESLENRDFVNSSIEELNRTISDRKIIYIGDFHSHDQYSRNFLRILKSCLEKYEVSIGMEMIFSDQQNMIDSFVDGHITEQEFLESINYKESWRFPWGHYKQLFGLAKNHKLKIVALNSNGNLQKRDIHAAKIMKSHIEQGTNDSKFFVLFGEYHIAYNKLPKEVNKVMESACSRLIIYQNLDMVYWKIKESDSNTDVVKFNTDEFAILSSPPWIKYESMFYWIQNQIDDPEYDLHEYLLECEVKFFNEDVRDYFLHFSEELNKTLKLKIKKEDIEDFNLLDFTNFEYLIDKVQEIQDPLILKMNLENLEKARTYKILTFNDYYCPSYSFNRLTYLAGLHLYWKYFKIKDAKKDIAPAQLLEICFNSQYFAYFCSKIYNPYRKCNLYQDILNSPHQSNRDKTEQSYILAILKQRTIPEKLLDRNVDAEFIFPISRILGHYCADKLFDEKNRPTSKIEEILIAPSTSIIETINKLIPLEKMISDKKRIF